MCLSEPRPSLILTADDCPIATGIDSVDVLEDKLSHPATELKRKGCRMKPVILLFAGLLIASCISDPRTEFAGPNGKLVAAVSCNGWFQTADDCRQRATDLCPEGYEPITLASGTDAVSKRGGLGGTPSQRLTIACR